MEDLERKRRVRGGHRASTKRLISKANEALSTNSTDSITQHNLIQHKMSIQGKLRTLNELDEAILALVDVDIIDEEIEQTDIFNESINGVLISIESQLVKCTHISETANTSGSISHSALSSGVKLPKLNLKGFDGKVENWFPFWDSYESSIHNNEHLSNVDKFNYLKSLLQHSAAESVSGLSLTAANYEEAISVLKRRFGNKQTVINRHMNLLLNLEPVMSNNNVKGLRHLHDNVEANVRGLRALGITPDSYGNLLSSILINKIPNELKLLINRKVEGDGWDLDKIMQVIGVELEARERAACSMVTKSDNTGPSFHQNTKGYPTASALVSVNSGPTCTYCKQGHTSNSCNTVTNVSARRDLLRKEGRCYICLRKNHISPDCYSKLKCLKCNGRHHVSICARGGNNSGSTKGPHREEHTVTTSSRYHEQSRPKSTGESEHERRPQNHMAMYVHSRMPILLQTARAYVYNLEGHKSVKVRIILDSGSQRTYISNRVKQKLGLKVEGTETMRIKTFGSKDTRLQTCEEVRFGLKARDGDILEMSAFSVPIICEPICGQGVLQAQSRYTHLDGLILADDSNEEESEVDILIGSDQYWKLVTGHVVRGEHGPIGMNTRLGWVLSGPVDDLKPSEQSSVNLVSTHVLRCAASPVQMFDEGLDGMLKRFWTLESMGVSDDEHSVYHEFEDTINFKEGRYEVRLPWRNGVPTLPDNFGLSNIRLDGLLKRLGRDPQLLEEYDSVIKSQWRSGIVDLVKNPKEGKVGRVHYLPHHAVLRKNRSTTKLRIVFDASAKSKGPSLNDSLYTGPSLTENILNIILRFRCRRIAVAGDIEKAFLMVSVCEEDRDVLRFLWVDDITKDNPEILTFKFNRVVFGVSSSPFLLNATIRHHLEKFREEDPEFVRDVLDSIYVDDVASGADDDVAAFELYIKAKSRLAEGGFNLRKFVTSSSSLRKKIEENESHFNNSIGVPNPTGADGTKGENLAKTEHSVHEDDASYSKITLGSGQAEASAEEQKILGVLWNFEEDYFVFDLKDVKLVAEDLTPTKRNVVSIAAKFYDPLGFLSPFIIQFKMLFQELCESKIDWDEPITGELKSKLDKLLKTLQESKPILMPRYYLCVDPDQQEKIESINLHGFCDASARGYGAVIYLKVTSTAGTYARFVVSKTRVAPLAKQTIPRLELLSALLLARLMVCVKEAIQTTMRISGITCWTDSKVALFWIYGVTKEWKQFVQNRVIEIRSLVPPSCWRHCPGQENPADIPSRGLNPQELSNSNLWKTGPVWLCEPNDEAAVSDLTVQPPEGLLELKTTSKGLQQQSTLLLQTEDVGIGNVIKCEDFSSMPRLLRVTAYVMKFVNSLLRKSREETKAKTGEEITQTELSDAETLWIKQMQVTITEENIAVFKSHQFGLFEDEHGIMRCGGRLSNANIPETTKHPILLTKEHHIASLIASDCHGRVMHCGVSATLAELRSRFWMPKGRQFVRGLIHRCVVCRKLEGRSFRAAPPPPLPGFRVKEDYPFSVIGIDFAGPLYVRGEKDEAQRKVWICLFTCATSRAVHIDLVSNLTSVSFIRCFRRFTARRGVPRLVVSDNAKTFKAASAELMAVTNKKEVKQHFLKNAIQWQFNLEKAPWWGGFFERLIKSTKRCLRKTIGGAKLNFDELLTIVCEVEMILNSRPISYVSTEELEEPLTPSHLMYGRRLSVLPSREASSLPDAGKQSSQNELSNRTRHVENVIQHFWRRWKREYLAGLREAHHSKAQGKLETVAVGDVVVIHDDNHSRGLWRLGKVEKIIASADGLSRGAVLKVGISGKQATTLRRPIQHLYPLEVNSGAPLEEVTCDQASTNVDGVLLGVKRQRRSAAIEADRKRKGWIKGIK